jgi:hypothetical protein
VSRVKGELARAFDQAERKERDVARTLAAPAWNSFKATADRHQVPVSCPAGCHHIRSMCVDVVVMHVARQHAWEAETIVKWLETLA